MIRAAAYTRVSTAVQAGEDPNIPGPAMNLANRFANALSGTRHDRVRRQLGNTRISLRTLVRKRS